MRCFCILAALVLIGCSAESGVNSAKHQSVGDCLVTEGCELTELEAFKIEMDKIVQIDSLSSDQFTKMLAVSDTAADIVTIRQLEPARGTQSPRISTKPINPSTNIHLNRMSTGHMSRYAIYGQTCVWGL